MTPQDPQLPLVVMLSYHTSPLEQPGQGDAGGMNVYVRRVSAALADLGHDVAVLIRRTSSEQRTVVLPESPRVQVIPVAAGPAREATKEEQMAWLPEFAMAATAQVRDLTSAGRSAVLHSHYWMSGKAGVTIAAALGWPWLHSMHTIGAVKNARDDDADEPEQRLRAETEIGLRADALISNTTIESAELIAYCSATDHRIHVIPPGVDHHIFRPDGAREWPTDDEHRLRLLFAGRFQPHKGPHVIIEALGLIHRVHHRLDEFDVHFTGAQSGARQLDLAHLAQQRGVLSACTFTPPLSPERLARLMRAADVQLMPSYSESFGLVGVEAQACGTPVLAHRVGGLTQAVEHGRSGRLVADLSPRSWSEALLAIADDAAAWSALSVSALDHAAGFSWTASAQQLSALYTRLLRLG